MDERSCFRTDCNYIVENNPNYFFIWEKWGIYNIQVRAKETDNLWGPWAELEVTMPVNQQVQYPFIQRLLERFPNAFPILRHLLEA